MMWRSVQLIFAGFLIEWLGLATIACGQSRPAAVDSGPVLEGYADIHVHQMANLGFGQSIIWGEDRGDPTKVLGPIRPDMRHGHDTSELATRGKTVPAILNALIGDIFRHGEEGYPSFRSWPATDRWTHQQVYEDWLFRAYQGGMRLMVMLAVNSEDMFGRGENEIPLLSHFRFQKVKKEGRTGNDMEALDWQIREAYELQKKVDREAGGTGMGWYRIVRDPEEAGRVIADGKLAVILGTELQHLFNCDTDRPQCTSHHIEEGLNRLEAMGVNYVFPVHHKLNQFAGPAKFVLLNNGPSEPCAEFNHPCSAVGLTDTGKFLVEELMSRGMLIDTEHLSAKAFNDAMNIAEQRRYPVMAGHVIPWALGSTDNEKSKSELARRNIDLERIFKVGGIVAPMLGTPTGEFVQNGQTQVRVCKQSASGSIDQWANAYLLLRDLATQAGVPADSSRIAMGTDWNGFAGWPVARASCASTTQVTYPFPLPTGLKQSAIGPVTELDLYTWPPKNGRTWDFNQVGAAHAGMVPDFLQGVSRLKPPDGALEPFYRSARGVVNVWSSARIRNEAWSRHHLRWTPQNAFDVFDYSVNDEKRNVYALDRTYALCRTRTGHKLGFLRDGKCELVEAGPPPRADAVQVAVYDSGRCLTVNSYRELEPATQYPCGTEANQFWYFRMNSARHGWIVNAMTDKCLTALAAEGHEAKVVQAECKAGNDAQVWDARRTGNTFQLIAQSNLCAEVKGQSRKSGAGVRQQTCNGASNQLWSVEALRQDDHELLYQADLERYAWLEHSSGRYPHPIEVREGSSICRATEGRWLGIVSGAECVGRTYSGEPAATRRFEGLYQMP